MMIGRWFEVVTSKAAEAEMDALANLRAEIRALGASSREGQRGVCGTRRAPVEVDVGSSLPPQRNASRLFGQA